ncbi:hypothetical protein NIES970_22070 [[Synechococcus] sp. NIES-970]|uniref:hypothetical protein n=1 Tax=Picosynechococcus sp. NKBG15041c TaxID=1407650 RepID=UPI0003FC2435|nr:hypothetical protein [Picosynechococcus sp. NKBG15041c]BAW97256.1 hypothetical protein NIES970_22070 [[Synechococcus] sp. NIES-970]
MKIFSAKTIAGATLLALTASIGIMTPRAIAGPATFTIAANGSITSNEAFNGTITGQAGGSVNSNFCGWISGSPNHTFRINGNGLMSLNLSVVDANGGVSRPFTILVKNADDPNAAPFCAIADPASGIPAEIGGAWNPGRYQVFIGSFERGGSASQAPYVLQISQ